MSTRNKLPIAFGAIVLLSVAAAIYGIQVVSSFGSLVASLDDGPSMAVSSAKSAQLDFAGLREPVERAVLLREVPQDAAVASIEGGRQQILADLQVARKRMPGADLATRIETARALAQSWFAMAMSYLKPPAQGLQELPVPAAFLAKGDEVTSAIDLVVEAASAYETDLRRQTEVSARAWRQSLILLNALAVIVGMIAAMGLASSLRRDGLGSLLSSLASAQSAMREMNQARERERAGQLAAFRVQVEEEQQRRQARA